jgi:kynureninase
MRPDRRLILMERGTFPTDVYVASGLAELLDRGHEVVTVEREELTHALDDRVAVLALSHVDYRTGALHDMADLTARAHRVGALALWDVAHSAGIMPLNLSDHGVDLAVGCGYKWLNGGPGAPAFLYVARRLQTDFRPGLVGWMGHADPFAFTPDYEPAAGMRTALVGTPAVLSTVALAEGLRTLADLDMADVRRKSRSLGELFLDLVDERLSDHGFGCPTPSDPDARGGQASLTHPHAHMIVQALIDRGVIGDFREPDILRFGLSPLILRHRDVDDAVAVLADVMDTRAWDDARYRTRTRSLTRLLTPWPRPWRLLGKCIHSR